MERTITEGTRQNIYGNAPDAIIAPTEDTNASGNKLTLGDGTNGPTISNGPAWIYGGYVPGDSNGSASNNLLTIKGGTKFATESYLYGGD